MKNLLIVIAVVCTLGFGYFLYREWERKKELKKIQLELEKAKVRIDQRIRENGLGRQIN